MSILKQATVQSYRPKKDKTVSITFSTQEINDRELLAIHNSIDTFGILYFSQKQVLTELEKQEIENADIKNNQGVSKSQKLRHVLYRLWEQKGKDGVFDTFYAHEMNRITQHFKDKLE